MPGYFGSERASWITYSEDFEHIDYNLGRACHYQLHHTDSDCRDGMLTAFNKQDEQSIQFTKDGIRLFFSQYADRIEWKQHNDLWYIKVNKLDTWPANVLYSFCILTRQAFEFPPVVKNYFKFLEAGLPDGLAFLLSYRDWDEKGDDPLKWKWDDDNHCGLNANHFFFYSHSDWVQMLEGRLINESVSFKDNPMRCTPASVIFGKSDQDDNLIDKTVQQVWDYYTGIIKEKAV